MSRNPRPAGRKPTDWDAQAGKYQRDVIGCGAGLFLLLGLPLLIGSFYALDIAYWLSSRGWSVLMYGSPSLGMRIIGGVFSIIGLIIVWFGLPSNPRTK